MLRLPSAALVSVLLVGSLLGATPARAACPVYTPAECLASVATSCPAPGLTCAFDLSRAAVTLHDPTIGFRCCSGSAP
jgi:hypothetical protein